MLSYRDTSLFAVEAAQQLDTRDFDRSNKRYATQHGRNR
jgi:hypothetical protein